MAGGKLEPLEKPPKKKKSKPTDHLSAHEFNEGALLYLNEVF